MYQAQLPLLTKGPLALFYGGDQLIPELSENSPGRGLPVLLFLSATFQVSLYILKYYKSRNLKIYVHSLTKSLVENVLNIYGTIVIILISITSFMYAILHYWSIEKNKKLEMVTKLVPKEIIIWYIVNMFCVILPFIKSYALR